MGRARKKRLKAEFHLVEDEVRDHANSVLDSVRSTIPIPASLTVFFTADRDTGQDWACRHLPEEARASFDSVWQGSKEAFYFRWKETRMVIVFLTEENQNIKEDENDLLGLLLHEIAHAFLDEKGLHSKIKKQYLKGFVRRIDLLDHPRFSMEEMYPVLVKLGSVSRLALKEHYMLRWLLKHDAGPYVLDNYSSAFPLEAPPEALAVLLGKKDFWDHLEDFSLLFEYTLILIAILTPFEDDEAESSRIFVQHMEEDYLASVSRMADRLSSVRELLKKEFSYTQAFQEKYFSEVFSVLEGFFEGNPEKS